MGALKNKILTFFNSSDLTEFKFRFSIYSFLSILSRVIFNSFLAFLIIELIINTSGIENAGETVKFTDYLIAFLALTLLNETLIVLDSIFEKFLPVPKKIRTRMFLQSVIGLLLIVADFYITTNIVTDYRDMPKSVRYISMAIGLTTVALFSSVLLLTRMVQKWIQSQKQYDEMKKENLKMNYTSLQDQLNPHFLFNNLSVLKSLIMFDEDAALKFTDNFSDVYRYVLQSKNDKLVKLGEELEFIKSYLGLHKERLGEGLKAEFAVDDIEKEKEIAPLTMQLLIENAIKHNITSRENPLNLKITVKEGELAITNNLQLKSTSYSTKTGLKNLKKRYAFLTDAEIDVTKTDDKFVVKIPLL